MCCRYVEADYKHEASRGLSATAELLVYAALTKPHYALHSVCKSCNLCSAVQLYSSAMCNMATRQ